MKVFHIITSFDLGGAERVALNIVESPNKNFEYHLVEVVRGRSEFTKGILDELERHNVTYHRAPFAVSNKIAIVLFPFWFLFLVISKRPQIIHSHTEVPDLSVFLFYKLFGWMFPLIKYVRTIHNTVLWSDWKQIGVKVESFFNKKKANIAISLSTQKCYKDVYGEDVPLIYNGVAEVKQKAYQGIVRGKINILFAGRLEYQKGIEQLIDVVKALEHMNLYVFHIVGSGSLQERVQTELGGLENVFLYDKIYGLSRYMGSFDYVFMPSNFEGLVLTSIEAGLAKTPVIANNCLGLNETLPEKWPLLVDNNCVAEYLHLFKDVIPSTARTELGGMAYHYVRRFFTLQCMREGYEKLYHNKLLQ